MKSILMLAQKLLCSFGVYDAHVVILIVFKICAFCHFDRRATTWPEVETRSKAYQIMHKKTNWKIDIIDIYMNRINRRWQDIHHGVKPVRTNTHRRGWYQSHRAIPGNLLRPSLGTLRTEQ